MMNALLRLLQERLQETMAPTSKLPLLIGCDAQLPQRQGTCSSSGLPHLSIFSTSSLSLSYTIFINERNIFFQKGQPIWNFSDKNGYPPFPSRSDLYTDHPLVGRDH